MAFAIVIHRLVDKTHVIAPFEHKEDAEKYKDEHVKSSLDRFDIMPKAEVVEMEAPAK